MRNNYKGGLVYELFRFARINKVKTEHGITMFIEFDSFGIRMRGYCNGWKNKRYF